MADWYRRKTWSDIDEKEFFVKLNRAKKENRSQYLRIQAIELFETKDLRLLHTAERLLKMIIADYPEDNLNKSLTLGCLGDIYRYSETYDKAVDYYKKAIDFEESYPTVITQAYLHYAELVVKLKKPEAYDFVEQIILKRIKNSIFPVEKYKAFSILSIINRFKGNKEQASQFAALAEQNASLKTSGLRYHKHLGVVNERVSWLDKLVKRK